MADMLTSGLIPTTLMVVQSAARTSHQAAVKPSRSTSVKRVEQHHCPHCSLITSAHLLLCTRTASVHLASDTLDTLAARASVRLCCLCTKSRALLVFRSCHLPTNSTSHICHLPQYNQDVHRHPPDLLRGHRVPLLPDVRARRRSPGEAEQDWQGSGNRRMYVGG